VIAVCTCFLLYTRLVGAQNPAFATVAVTHICEDLCDAAIIAATCKGVSEA